VFFANVEVGLVGHNIKADGMWLYRLGLDIREYTHYDTMLAEHLINSLGPFGLTDLTLKYTSMGRYDEYVVKWKHNHKDLAVDGYGAIPDEFLLPYSAGDVQATWQVMVAQQPAMGRYYAPRGLQQEYPPLATSTLHMCSMLYEMEANGLTVDRSRLQELTKLYNDKRRELLAAFPAMVVPYGYTDFNPGSPVQVAKLLFNPTNANGLGLLPIKATGKPAKSWEWVLDQNPEVRKQYAPSTDSATLEILETKHPLVRQILNMRRINKACEAYLREDELGGIPGNIWADGRLHAGFGQLTDTGRLNSHNPNVQNFPKSSEGYILEIFGKGIAIPPTRSVIVADPLCVLFEADYAQAELFILAALADDEVMMGALTTPGKDLHDLTAISAFQLQVFMPDGSAANEEYLLRLAAADPAAYGKLLKELVYVDQKGKRMTRSEFKDTIRVSAKSINFGIPYGRGAAAIALQVKAETGLPIAESEVAAGIRKWKETYSQAWKCLCWYQAHGLKNKYVESPWGRRRYFNHPEFEYEKAGLQREAGNFPIQSTVADTMAIAADRIVQERARRKLKFTFRNQVHDSFLFNVPTTEVAAAREVIREGMGGIRIPMPSGKPLTLGVDIDVYERWSEKQKD
jgi:DNA polymerase I-like protein with 3'-5' exonuclease and polymerase domains